MSIEWIKYRGMDVQAPISCGEDYVISHRPGNHTLSYRPPNEHHHVGSFETRALAKAAAEEHKQGLRPSYPIDIMAKPRLGLGLAEFWKPSV